MLLFEFDNPAISLRHLVAGIGVQIPLPLQFRITTPQLGFEKQHIALQLIFFLRGSSEGGDSPSKDGIGLNTKETSDRQNAK